MVGSTEGGVEWIRLSCHPEGRVIRMKVTCIAIPLRIIDSLGHIFLCNDDIPLLSVEENMSMNERACQQESLLTLGVDLSRWIILMRPETDNSATKDQFEMAGSLLLTSLRSN